ncbi:DinB family protein [Hymenobacter sp. YC55]|uniref:DinB family protein n=1 Tax=Hymenobacter sp. YC55 TaxID=3034019 RepID=UPI0023F9355E|nr:DinB family protein [Hymenobacter sp. YC55]MDF7812066.1 DinB family protein [Hymenobacter sp. YC55]
MEQQIRERMVEELSNLLVQGNAHVTFEDACADVPPHLLNEAVPGLPYTVWQLAEHIRIAQWDIVEFSLDPNHTSPKWPDDYWPATESKGDAASWQATLTQIKHDRDRFIGVLEDTSQDLFAPFPHGTGQTLFREALLIGDHTAYHTGQIILLRRMLKDWE